MIAPSTTGELALQVMRQQATLFAEHVPQARPGSDPEHVHQTRVATRRLRAALRLFHDLLPSELEALHEELGWIAGQLGPVRDLDVQLQRIDDIAAELEATEPLAPYRGWLEERRSAAQACFDEAFQSARFVALVECLRQLNQLSPSASEALEKDAPRRLRQAYRKFRKRADGIVSESPATEFHKVRIRAKRLRYACEFFEPLYGKPAERVVEAATAMQDLLGEHQDGVVSAQHVDEAIASAGTTWPSETLVALGRLVQWEAQRAATRRQNFRPAVKQVRQTYRRLRRRFY